MEDYIDDNGILGNTSGKPEENTTPTEANTDEKANTTESTSETNNDLQFKSRIDLTELQNSVLKIKQ